MWKTLLVWEVGLVAVTVQGHGPCKLLHGIMVNFSLDEVSMHFKITVPIDYVSQILINLNQPRIL